MHVLYGLVLYLKKAFLEILCGRYCLHIWSGGGNITAFDHIQSLQRPPSGHQGLFV